VTTVLPAQCFACTRLRSRRSPSGGPLASICGAFPAGIPEVMQRGGDHRQPLPGDSGLQFVQADTDRARAAFDVWQRFAAATQQ
jgi:hypothetical protein